MKELSNIIGTLLILAFSVGTATAQDAGASTAKTGGDSPKSVAITGETAVIPMELYGRKPVVDVKINGKGPFKFFLDTGAAATVLDQKLADELKLPADGITKIGDPSDPVGISANRDRIDTLEVGGATFSEVIGVSWDRSPLYKEGAPRGVLGMPLFKDLLLTVDYPKKQIIVSRGSLPKANKNDVLDYTFSERGLFGIPVKIGSEDMIATLDTGSPGGISFPSEYMEKLPLVDKPKEIGRAKTVGGEGAIYGAKLRDKVKLGGYVFDDPDVSFFGRLVHLNIGYGFIGQFAITIDQRNQRIKFDRPATNAAAVDLTDKIVDSAEYAGMFGIRRVTVENGDVYLQRLSGPQGEGPKLKLVSVSKDAFALPGTSEIRIKFTRDSHGAVTGLQVLTQSGNWETSAKGSLGS